MGTSRRPRTFGGAPAGTVAGILTALDRHTAFAMSTTPAAAAAAPAGSAARSVHGSRSSTGTRTGLRGLLAAFNLSGRRGIVRGVG